MTRILVPGGAGYIGSHTVIELLRSGYEVVVVDNLVNSHAKAVEAIEQITGKSLTFYEGDIRDKTLLKQIFERHQIDAVINFAAYKAVGESVADPLKYYDNNVVGMLPCWK